MFLSQIYPLPINFHPVFCMQYLINTLSTHKVKSLSKINSDFELELCPL